MKAERVHDLRATAAELLEEASTEGRHDVAFALRLAVSDLEDAGELLDRT